MAAAVVITHIPRAGKLLVWWTMKWPAELDDDFNWLRGSKKVLKEEWMCAILHWLLLLLNALLLMHHLDNGLNGKTKLPFSYCFYLFCCFVLFSSSPPQTATFLMSISLYDGKYRSVSWYSNSDMGFSRLTVGKEEENGIKLKCSVVNYLVQGP